MIRKAWHSMDVSPVFKDTNGMSVRGRVLRGVWRDPVRGIVPRDFLGLLLFVFIIGSASLFGQGQLMALGFMLTGCYTLYFLKQKKPIPTEIIVYFAWIVWSLSGLMVCRDSELYRNSMLLITQIWLMTFAIAGITMQRGSIGTNFLAIVIGGVIMFVSSYETGELVRSASLDDRVRIHGIMANPNNYARILLIAIMASLYFMRRHFPLTTRIMALLAIGACSYGIVYSASRQAFVGLFALIILWMSMCYGKKIFQRKSYLAIIALTVVALFFLTDYMLSNTYMGFRFKYDFIDNPVTQRHQEHKRLAYYEEGFQIIRDNPLFGVGLGNFQVFSKHSSYSHSDYIEVASSTGIVGFIMYFSIYFMMWRRLSRLRRSVRDEFIAYNISLLKACILVILLLAFTKPNLYVQNTWILLGSAMGYAWFLQMKADSIRRIYRAQTSF